MDELDLLKKHWQKDDDFPKVNKEEIRRMLYKSSSSLVKWIFIISVIELFAGILLNVYLYTNNIIESEDSNIFDTISNVLDLIAYVVILYFIYSFFKSYRKIRTTSNTKELLSNILFTRKTVGYYMKFNIYLIIFAIALTAIQNIWEEDVIHRSAGHNFLFFTVLVLVVFVVGWLSIAILKFYYRLIYIRLVKKLDKNYDDLVKLEEEDIKV